MDEKRNLILIKGENKTWQIEYCRYDPQDQRYHVTFTNGRTYPYGYSSVQWLKLSMEYLKAIFYNRYGGRQERPIFTMDAIWKTPLEILREYPIILSTTFSSRSCLKDATYDYLIMDEASQVDLATGALALASARCAVIVGDLKQLPNVIPENLRKQSEAVFQSYHLQEG